MQLTVISQRPKRWTNACLVVGVTGKGTLTQAADEIDTALDGLLKRTIKQGDISGKPGEALMIVGTESEGPQRVLLVGVGDEGASHKDYRRIAKAVVKAVRDSGAQRVVSTLAEQSNAGDDIAWRCHTEALEAMESAYRFTGHDGIGKKVTAKSAQPNSTLKQWDFLISAKAELKPAKRAVKEAVALSEGCSLARDLGNLAPNICTPDYLAKQARTMGKDTKKLSVSVLDEAQMKKMGMHSLLSVSRGSRQPAKLICMEYKGAAKSVKPLVLVGKGITFDTGGISLKPGAAMDEMKYDMCGAAGVFGVMQACVNLDLKCNLVCVVAAAENMPDGDASRPGDVVATLSGQTVEILNTDAEGRLVLCDALTYVKKYKPAAVIDVATLTGACIIALGHVASAVMSNDDDLTDDLVEAGLATNDRTWPLPLWDDYQSQLDSNFADMGNIGGRAAGSITAGCFLSRFAKEYKWAHLDIAGVAWRSGGKAKGATGRPVPLLMAYLQKHHVA